MQIQLNTDNHIEGGEQLALDVEAVLETTLQTFGGRITRVEVYVADENSSQKGGAKDKRCTLEARVAGLQPISVTDLAPSIQQAIEGAAVKLKKSLQRTFGRLDDRKGRPSFGDTTDEAV